MCKTEKFFVSSIEDRLEGVSRDIQYLIDNHSENKDKWIWFQAKLNDMSRLLNSIKKEIKWR